MVISCSNNVTDTLRATLFFMSQILWILKELTCLSFKWCALVIISMEIGNLLGGIGDSGENYHTAPERLQNMLEKGLI